MYSYKERLKAVQLCIHDGERGTYKINVQMGCSPDNSACEGFFGRLKNEMFYGQSRKDVSIDEFIIILDEYIHWYLEKRINLSLRGTSPHPRLSCCGKA